MKLTVERDAALRALNLVRGVVARSATLDILKNVLLIAGDGTLRIIATDNKMEANTYVTCRSEGDGATTVSAQHLGDILKNLPEGSDLHMEVGEANEMISKTAPLLVKAGRFKSRVPALSPDDFPLVADEVVSSVFLIQASTLASMFADSAFAAVADESKPMLNTVYLHLVGTKLRAVSAGAPGLSYSQIDAPDEVVSFDPVMIPIATVRQVESLIAAGKPEEMVSVERTGRRVIFTLGATTLASLIVTGSYPAYERLIPNAPDQTITVDAVEFETALRRALVMSADEKVKRVWLKVVGQTLGLRGRNAMAGESADEIDCDASGDVAVTVMGPQLLEVMGHIRTENVEIKVHGGTRVTVCEPNQDARFNLITTLTTE